MNNVVIRDAEVLDCTGREPGGPMDVLVRDGRIESIKPAGRTSVAAGTPAIDGAGCTLMPGLTDAHVHFAIIGTAGDHGTDPWILHVLKVAELIGAALDEGFTTVRDAGGLEPAWANIVESGRIRGPRILPSGSLISQTGGHGDPRAQHDDLHLAASIPGLVARAEVVDGVDAVRRAVREQLRRGATQIKLLASGGIMSPSDPFDSVQFSTQEIGAAVDVAKGFGTYVLAHCHTSPAIEVAIDAGVRSIEHGSVLEPSTARRMAAGGTFMVPTLQVLNDLAGDPSQFQLPLSKQARLQWIARTATESVRTADGAGVMLGSGSDLIGPNQRHRGREIVFKAYAIGAHQAIISATRTNAQLFNLGDRIGTVEVGKDADLILVKGEPLADVEILADPAKIAVVVKGGVVVKDTEARSGQGRASNAGDDGRAANVPGYHDLAIRSSESSSNADLDVRMLAPSQRPGAT